MTFEFSKSCLMVQQTVVELWSLMVQQTVVELWSLMVQQTVVELWNYLGQKIRLCHKLLRIFPVLD